MLIFPGGWNEHWQAKRIHKFFEVNFFSSGPQDQPVLHFVQQLKRRTVKLSYGLNTKSHLGPNSNFCLGANSFTTRPENHGPYTLIVRHSFKGGPEDQGPYFNIFVRQSLIYNRTIGPGSRFGYF